MESAVQVIVGKLGELVADEIRKARAVSGEVVHLRNELATMNAALLMLSEADDSAVDHLLREWGSQVRDLAFDVEDCIDIYRVKHYQVGAGRNVHRMIQKFRLRSSLFEDVQALRARAVVVGECHARYVVTRQALRARSAVYSHPVQPVVPPSSTARGSSCQTIGNGKQIKRVAERLMAVSKRGTDFKVFSIHGVVGSGKTTLAMEVYRQLEDKFDCQALVSVSRAFDPRKNLKGLLELLLRQILKVKNIDEMDVERLSGKLKESLQGKRYLVVIDDVRSIASWNAIQPMLPVDNLGSRIVVTTRTETVAKACSDGNVYGENMYHINPLHQNELRSFVQRSLAHMDYRLVDPVFRKCGGLPLAIISITSLLNCYTWSEMKTVWKTIVNLIDSGMDDKPTFEGMKRIITLSYNHLPNHLKVCMMYISIFPGGHAINKERLLYRWIAEGLVEEKRGLTLLEVAEAYFDELVSRNMIVLSMDTIFNHVISEETYWVHDIMLEILVSKSMEVNFVSLVGGQHEGMTYNRIRRLSIHGDEQASTSATNTVFDKIMNMKNVRSLTIFESQGHKLLDRIGEFTLLSVLDLEDNSALENKHLKDICCLFLLRFLSLKGTYVTVMPKEVGKLEHLQTLDVRATCLDRLPETMIKLEKLERLLFSHKTDRSIMWKPPHGLQKMKALHEVSSMILKNDICIAEEIGELEQLQRLSIYVDCDGQEILKQLACSLSKTHSLRFLSIGDMRHASGALDSLYELLPSPPRLLRFLRFAGGLNKLPSWVSSLTFLVEFRISSAHLVDDELFSVLCKCPELMTIVLELNHYTGEELVARTSFDFLKLRNLDVSIDHEHPKVFRFKKRSMRYLEKLSVNFGSWSEKSIVGIEHMKNLKEVQLTGKKGNPALVTALEKLKRENGRRPGDKQFKVVVKYQ